MSEVKFCHNRNLILTSTVLQVMTWIVPFIQSKYLKQTIPVSNNQIARLDEDNVKIEQSVEETISQSEPIFRTQMWELHIKMKFLQPYHPQSINILNY